MNRTAYIDEQQYAREFTTGDTVRKSSLRDFVLTPYVGRVLYSNPRTGRVSVQWPWGVESESPVELIKSISEQFMGPTQDTGYSSYEAVVHTSDKNTEKDNLKFRRSIASAEIESIKEDFEDAILPTRIAVFKALYDGCTPDEAFDRVSSSVSRVGLAAVQSEIETTYMDGHRLAIYRKKNSERQYRMTRGEIETGRINCPRCASKLYDRRFRANRNVKQCRSCGFTIHSQDIRRS